LELQPNCVAPRSCRSMNSNAPRAPPRTGAVGRCSRGSRRYRCGFNRPGGRSAKFRSDLFLSADVFFFPIQIISAAARIRPRRHPHCWSALPTFVPEIQPHPQQIVQYFPSELYAGAWVGYSLAGEIYIRRNIRETQLGQSFSGTAPSFSFFSPRQRAARARSSDCATPLAAPGPEENLPLAFFPAAGSVATLEEAERPAPLCRAVLRHTQLRIRPTNALGGRCQLLGMNTHYSCSPQIPQRRHPPPALYKTSAWCFFFFFFFLFLPVPARYSLRRFPFFCRIAKTRNER